MLNQKQITIVAAVIRNENGEVLLAKRNQQDIPEIHGKWEFVGGGIDFGEDPVEAVKREVKEEAGIDVEVLRLLPKIISDTQSWQDGNTTQVLIISYECKIIGGSLGADMDEEIAELKFVPVKDISNYDTFNNIPETLKLLSGPLI